MICRHLTPAMVVMARNMDAASTRVRDCRRSRSCVWCDEPVEPHRVYPACEDCRAHRDVQAP